MGRALLVVLAFAGLAQADSWTVLSGELTVPRHAFTSEVVGEKIYAVGGLVNPGGPGDAKHTLSIYDPAVDAWSLGDSMSTARHSLGAAVVDGLIYAIGGHVSNSRGENQVYDPVADDWSSAASLGTSRSDPGVAAFGGQVYVFGGNSFASYQTSIERYDPFADSWSYVGNTPVAGVDMEAVVLGSLIYLVGGFKIGGQLDQLVAYDPVTNTWDTGLPSMNVARSAHQVVTANGRIYAIGGANTEDGILGSVESWAPGESSWRIEVSLNVARAQFGAEVVGNSIYAFGGWSASHGELGSTERLGVQPIPEPGTLALLGSAGLVLLSLRRRMRR